MDAIASVSQFLVDTGLSLYTMLRDDWYLLGTGLIAIFVMSRVIRFIKKMFM